MQPWFVFSVCGGSWLVLSLSRSPGDACFHGAPKGYRNTIYKCKVYRFQLHSCFCWACPVRCQPEREKHGSFSVD